MDEIIPDLQSELYKFNQLVYFEEQCLSFLSSSCISTRFLEFSKLLRDQLTSKFTVLALAEKNGLKNESSLPSWEVILQGIIAFMSFCYESIDILSNEEGGKTRLNEINTTVLCAFQYLPVHFYDPWVSAVCTHCLPVVMNTEWYFYDESLCFRFELSLYLLVTGSFVDFCKPSWSTLKTGYTLHPSSASSKKLQRSGLLTMTRTPDEVSLITTLCNSHEVIQRMSLAVVQELLLQDIQKPSHNKLLNLVLSSISSSSQSSSPSTPSLFVLEKINNNETVEDFISKELHRDALHRLSKCITESKHPEGTPIFSLSEFVYGIICRDIWIASFLESAHKQYSRDGDKEKVPAEKGIYLTENIMDLIKNMVTCDLICQERTSKRHYNEYSSLDIDDNNGYTNHDSSAMDVDVISDGNNPVESNYNEQKPTIENKETKTENKKKLSSKDHINPLENGDTNDCSILRNYTVIANGMDEDVTIEKIGHQNFLNGSSHQERHTAEDNKYDGSRLSCLRLVLRLDLCRVWKVHKNRNRITLNKFTKDKAHSPIAEDEKENGYLEKLKNHWSILGFLSQDESFLPFLTEGALLEVSFLADFLTNDELSNLLFYYVFHFLFSSELERLNIRDFKSELEQEQEERIKSKKKWKRKSEKVSHNKTVSAQYTQQLLSSLAVDSSVWSVVSYRVLWMLYRWFEKLITNFSLKCAATINNTNSNSNSNNNRDDSNSVAQVPSAFIGEDLHLKIERKIKEELFHLYLKAICPEVHAQLFISYPQLRPLLLDRYESLTEETTMSTAMSISESSISGKSSSSSSSFLSSTSLSMVTIRRFVAHFCSTSYGLEDLLVESCDYARSIPKFQFLLQKFFNSNDLDYDDSDSSHNNSNQKKSSYFGHYHHAFMSQINSKRGSETYNAEFGNKRFCFEEDLTRAVKSTINSYVTIIPLHSSNIKSQGRLPKVRRDEMFHPEDLLLRINPEGRENIIEHHVSRLVYTIGFYNDKEKEEERRMMENNNDPFSPPTATSLNTPTDSLENGDNVQDSTNQDHIFEKIDKRQQTGKMFLREIISRYYPSAQTFLLDDVLVHFFTKYPEYFIFSFEPLLMKILDGTVSYNKRHAPFYLFPQLFSSSKSSNSNNDNTTSGRSSKHTLYKSNSSSAHKENYNDNQQQLHHHHHHHHQQHKHHKHHHSLPSANSNSGNLAFYCGQFLKLLLLNNVNLELSALFNDCFRVAGDDLKYETLLYICQSSLRYENNNYGAQIASMIEMDVKNRKPSLVREHFIPVFFDACKLYLLANDFSGSHNSHNNNNINNNKTKRPPTANYCSIKNVLNAVHIFDCVLVSYFTQETSKVSESPLYGLFTSQPSYRFSSLVSSTPSPMLTKNYNQTLVYLVLEIFNVLIHFNNGENGKSIKNVAVNQSALELNGWFRHHFLYPLVDICNNNANHNQNNNINRDDAAGSTLDDRIFSNLMNPSDSSGCYCIASSLLEIIFSSTYLFNALFNHDCMKDLLHHLHTQQQTREQQRLQLCSDFTLNNNLSDNNGISFPKTIRVFDLWRSTWLKKSVPWEYIHLLVNNIGVCFGNLNVGFDLEDNDNITRGNGNAGRDKSNDVIVKDTVAALAVLNIFDEYLSKCLDAIDDIREISFFFVCQINGECWPLFERFLITFMVDDIDHAKDGRKETKPKNSAHNPTSSLLLSPLVDAALTKFMLTLNILEDSFQVQQFILLVRNVMANSPKAKLILKQFFCQNVKAFRFLSSIMHLSKDLETKLAVINILIDSLSSCFRDSGDKVVNYLIQCEEWEYESDFYFGEEKEKDLADFQGACSIKLSIPEHEFTEDYIFALVKLVTEEESLNIIKKSKQLLSLMIFMLDFPKSIDAQVYSCCCRLLHQNSFTSVANVSSLVSIFLTLLDKDPDSFLLRLFTFIEKHLFMTSSVVLSSSLSSLSTTTTKHSNSSFSSRNHNSSIDYNGHNRHHHRRNNNNDKRAHNQLEQTHQEKNIHDTSGDEQTAFSIHFLSPNPVFLYLLAQVLKSSSVQDGSFDISKNLNIWGLICLAVDGLGKHSDSIHLQQLEIVECCLVYEKFLRLLCTNLLTAVTTLTTSKNSSIRDMALSVLQHVSENFDERGQNYQKRVYEDLQLLSKRSPPVEACLARAALKELRQRRLII